MSVCLSARISQNHTFKLHEIIRTLLTVAGARSSSDDVQYRYAMYFRFCGSRHFAHNRPGKGDAHKAYTQSDSPGGRTGGVSMFKPVTQSNSAWPSHRGQAHCVMAMVPATAGGGRNKKFCMTVGPVVSTGLCDKQNFPHRDGIYQARISGGMVSSRMKKCRCGIPFHTVPLPARS